MTFKERMQQKFTVATPTKTKKKKVLPYLTEPVQKMRQHLGEFYKLYPKTAQVFSKSNRAYAIAWKYLNTEDLLQIAFISYLVHYHPEIHHRHIDNERRGKLGNVQKAKVMLMGVSSGVSDMLLQCQGLPDAWIELKVKPNRPTQAQKDFLALQESLGKFTGVAYNMHDCSQLVKEWKELK
jgi:hypothetical protein